MTDREEAAASSIAGLAELYARGGRLSWDTAMREIQERLRVWEIRPKRIGEVMSMAATGYVDSDAWRARVALHLLLDAGADEERARVIRAQAPPRRVAGLGRPAPDRSPGSAAGQYRTAPPPAPSAPASPGPASPGPASSGLSVTA